MGKHEASMGFAGCKAPAVSQNPVRPNEISYLTGYWHCTVVWEYVAPLCFLTLDRITMKYDIVLTLLLCASQVTAQAATPCLDDVDACLPDFRNRLIDNNYFWYGKSRYPQCGGGFFCINDRSDLTSVMARVLITNDSSSLQAAVSNIQVLNVTFLQRATKYFACDMTIKVPAEAPTTIDPLQPTLLPQILIQHQPQVTWTPRTSQTLYTFIFYDTSYLFLHTFFVNCNGGSLDGCEVVRPWLGTSPVFLINSPYIFMVFEQKSRVPIAIAQQATQETAAEGLIGSTSPLGVFYISVLTEKLNAYLNTNVQFASIMEMYPDPYGSFRLTNFFNTVDQCPLFYSQLPAFHSAVRLMQVPNPKWSSPAFGFSQLAVAPFLTSITVNVHVSYDTDDFSEEACCKQFQLTRGTHMVSALDTRPVRAAATRHAPRVFLSPVQLMGPGAGRNGIAALLYTLVAVDLTPALTSNTTGTNLTVHWLVVNIFGSDFATGLELVPYSAPTPTNANEPISLMFLLLAHSTPVDPTTLRLLCPEEPMM
ncbi:hypothetical protein RRG08_006890 [Elysia crispata]|uniref:Uncharacterized protein n=1 Tax=Elysia crispata TaxID=231223 RepID=A0AAE1BB02_9GAST|nr:hypothetical protein RRG08_006890 [Elysia crispata]